MNEQTNFEQIRLIDLIKLSLRHWWKIVLAAVLGAVLAFVLSEYYLTPVYTSRGSLYVNNNLTQRSQNVNLSDLATSQQLAYTYVELLNSDTFIIQVQKYSQLPYTADRIKGMIYMHPLNDTEIIEVKANSYYPEHSQILVDSILKNAQDEIMRVIQAGSITIVDEATLPEFPSSPNVPRNTFLGFFIGAMLSMLAIFIINTFDTRIASEADLQRVHKLPLLGSIPNFGICKDAEGKKHENQ